MKHNEQILGAGLSGISKAASTWLLAVGLTGLAFVCAAPAVQVEHPLTINLTVITEVDLPPRSGVESTKFVKVRMTNKEIIGELGIVMGQTFDKGARLLAIHTHDNPQPRIVIRPAKTLGPQDVDVTQFFIFEGLEFEDPWYYVSAYSENLSTGRLLRYTDVGTMSVQIATDHRYGLYLCGLATDSGKTWVVKAPGTQQTFEVVAGTIKSKMLGDLFFGDEFAGPVEGTISVGAPKFIFQ
jgi:hypothetical protein